MGVQSMPFMGIEVGVGVLLARRPACGSGCARRRVSRSLLSAATSPAARSPRRPAGDHLYAGDRDLPCPRGRRQRRRLPVGIAIALRSIYRVCPRHRGDRQDARGDARPGDLRDPGDGDAGVRAVVCSSFRPGCRRPLVVPTRWPSTASMRMTWRGLGFDAAIAPIAVLFAFSAPCSRRSRSGASTGKSRAAEWRRRRLAAILTFDVIDVRR